MTQCIVYIEYNVTVNFCMTLPICLSKINLDLKCKFGSNVSNLMPFISSFTSLVDEKCCGADGLANVWTDVTTDSRDGLLIQWKRYKVKNGVT